VIGHLVTEHLSSDGSNFRIGSRITRFPLGEYPRSSWGEIVHYTRNNAKSERVLRGQSLGLGARTNHFTIT